MKTMTVRAKIILIGIGLCVPFWWAAIDEAVRYWHLWGIVGFLGMLIVPPACVIGGIVAYLDVMSGNQSGGKP